MQKQHVNHKQGSPDSVGMPPARRSRTLMLVALLSLLVLGVVAEVVNAVEVPIPTK